MNDKYEIGDEITVGGITFTKISNYPFPVDDANCFTMPDGECVSDRDCMHGPAVHKVEDDE